MLKTKTAPAKTVKVEETKTLKILDFDGNSCEETTEIKRTIYLTIVDITDNDREFLKEISHSYKESNHAYHNEIGFYISLVDRNIDEIVGMCLVYKANIDLAKLIYNVLFDNIVDSNFKKPIYTHLHIWTYDNDID